MITSRPDQAAGRGLVLAAGAGPGLVDVYGKHPAGERVRATVLIRAKQALATFGAMNADNDRCECHKRSTGED